MVNLLPPKQLSTLSVYGVATSLLIFAFIAEHVLQRNAFAWDTQLLYKIHNQATPINDNIMLFITHMGDVQNLMLVIAVLSLGLLVLKQFRQTIFFATACGGAAVFNIGLKVLFHRSRPELWPRLIPEHDFGFPSGHAMGSTAVVVALVVLLWKTQWRWLAMLFGAGFVVAICVSRLYLGVHYPSDVIAGVLVSVAWVGTIARFPFLNPNTMQKN